MSCTTPAYFSTFFLLYYGPYSSWKFLIFSVLVCLLFFVNTTIMIMIEMHSSRGFHHTSMDWTPLFASDRLLTSLDKLLFKNLRTKISVLSHNHLPQDFIWRHSLLFIENYVILYWYAISASKIIAVVVFKSNTGDVGRFLQVYHYWGVNICCKSTRSRSLKLWTISVWN